ncbi:hypothetical protein SARC_02094 [Sphaeroforma arctica JP610]|uniref:Uncharacterized protein n=1 Tax=Sphaeroforma arctica JP610 TaxID=667725 RepID=A0A0L0G9P1_9EUKA|nr:hypothetical protein SARC_02094 [Sphaeroforma arctica JP610]KNC85720.1 hypothetical protein SARC_02094 [Sphaeroforma arctica JP610]|eukprot:XP_014159622.1 hypothetical protein SARC_02094 [Sphaeroforma arctica JP610]
MPNEETVTPADVILPDDEIDDLVDAENGINEEQLALESAQTQNGGSGYVSKSLLVTLGANKARELVNSLLTSKNSDKVYVNSGNCIDPLSYTQKVKDNTTYDFVAMYQWHLEGTLHQKELEPVVFSSANFLCIYHASSRVPWPRCSLLQCADKFCQRCL